MLSPPPCCLLSSPWRWWGSPPPWASAPASWSPWTSPPQASLGDPCMGDTKHTQGGGPARRSRGPGQPGDPAQGLRVLREGGSASAPRGEGLWAGRGLCDDSPPPHTHTASCTHGQLARQPHPLPADWRVGGTWLCTCFAMRFLSPRQGSSLEGLRTRGDPVAGLSPMPSTRNSTGGAGLCLGPRRAAGALPSSFAPPGSCWKRSLHPTPDFQAQSLRCDKVPR